MRSAIAVAVLAVLVNNTLSTSPIEGYEVEEASWAIEVIPGKPPAIFNGTVEQVMAQLEADYPDFAASALENINKEAAILANASPAPADILTKRDHNICYNFPMASTGRIQEGINYLHGLTGRPWLGPGPRNCQRVSCSWRAAIWWCNDNNYRVEHTDWHGIANAAQVIVNECARGASDVSGQRFHNDNINMIVRDGDC
ncbi:hypothetical protein B0I35DRAFT_451748 [Stachybotrys elegans]|uniref:SCP domain-containing protein n=1 Tax=Stachybotrys elegans TaxID=80388 RepID=A0A8K0WPY8_9HYPO|nr:hypothetical protein B0I35DRAFT_451748 [Stachybotrys elegans]